MLLPQARIGDSILLVSLEISLGTRDSSGTILAMALEHCDHVLSP